MAKGVRRFTGFLWALLIAVLSFFIIFIFFPDVSSRFFGVSIRGEDVRRVVKDIGDTVTDKVTDVVDKTVDAVSDAVADTVSDTVRSKVPEAVESGKRTVADTVQNSGLQSK